MSQIWINFKMKSYMIPYFVMELHITFFWGVVLKLLIYITKFLQLIYWLMSSILISFKMKSYII